MFKKDLIIFSDKVYQNKFELINDTANLSNENVNDATAYAMAVADRETKISTYVGHGIAIPHAITYGVDKPFVIYQKLHNELEWGENNEKVNHIFMIGVPKSDKGSSSLHLKIISELSKNLMRENFRDKLLNSKDTEEVYEMLNTMKEGMIA